jgi:DNA-directed RNA polymerase subunit RPC12/RpoP
MKKDKTKSKCYAEDEEIKCPYCGYVVDKNNVNLIDNDATGIKCMKCSELFAIYVETTRYYYTIFK